jgi:hypothetical protein
MDTGELLLESNAHSDVGHYRISHNPLTISDPWILYEGKPINYLLPSASGSGMITIYAEVKNTDGLITSDRFTDTILFDTSTAANADNDGNGISDANEITHPS